MDPLKAFSADFHTTVAASFLRQALEASKENPVSSKSQQLIQYTEQTFPIMVSPPSEYRVQPIICTTSEPFDEFLKDLKRIMKINTETNSLRVRWDFGIDIFHGTVTPENLHAILRMMQMRSGKDYFELVKI